MTKTLRAKLRCAFLPMLLCITPVALANSDQLQSLIEKSDTTYYKDIDASIRYAQQAVELAKAERAVPAEADSLFLLGRALKKNKQRVEAEKHLTQSLALNREVGTPQKLADNLIHLGDAMRFTKKFDQGIMLVDEAIALVSTLDEIQLKLDAHNVKGNVLKTALDYEGALKQYEISMPYAKEVGSQIEIARAYKNAAWVSKKLGLTEKQLEYSIVRAEALEKTDNTTELAKAYGDVAKSYQKQGDDKKAADFNVKTLELAEKSADTDELIQSYLNIAALYDSIEESALSAKYRGKAVELIKTTKDVARLALELEYLSTDQRRLGQYAPALENAKKALEIQESLSNNHRIAKLLLNISIIYRKLSSYDSALDYSARLLRIHESSDDLNGIASASNELGLLYTRLRQYEDAGKHYNKTLILGVEEIDPKYRAAAYRGLAVVAQNADELFKALDYAKESEKIYREINSDHGASTVNRTIGKIYENLGEPKKALKAFLIGLEQSRAIGNRWSEASSLIHVGELEFRLNKRKGKNSVLEGLRIAEELSAKSLSVDAYAALMRMERTLGNYKLAYDYSIKHISLSAEINQEEITQRVAELQIIRETEKHEREIEMLKRQSQINGLELGRQSAELEILNKQKTISGLQLERERFIRTIFLGFSILVVLALALLYTRFRYAKQRQNILNEKNHQIASKNAKLEDLNATKDRFFSIIAHDLRGPVSSLVSLTQMLEDNFDNYNKEEIKKYISAVNSSSTQTYKLLDDLLGWAIQQLRNTDPVPRMHFVADICLSVENTLAGIADAKEIEIINKVDPTLPIYADRNMITTVIRNLVANSIKFSEHKGIINLYASHSNEEVTVHVKDNGVGMDKNEIKCLFQIDKMMSRRGTDGEKGTGFGLALCKDLIEKNGGQIQVSSKKGVGSDFHFTIPRKKPSSQSQKANKAP